MCFVSGFYAQNQENFTVFYSKNKYNVKTQIKIDKFKNFKTYRLMVGAHIDPKNKGFVDREVFQKNIQKAYVNKNESGVLVLDLENKPFKDLYKFDKGTIAFEKAAEEFIWMLKTVKKLRPNVKVGIYGLPYRAYYPHTKNTDKLDKILTHTDYLFPSLYTMYPDRQIGKKRNTKYLKENIETALKFGIRLDKPVVPFVWSMVHPSNKLHAGELVSKSEMIDNIKFIKNFEYKNEKVYGVVWWDPDERSYGNMRKKSNTNKIKNFKEEQSKVFKEYMSKFGKRKFCKN